MTFKKHIGNFLKQVGLKNVLVKVDLSLNNYRSGLIRYLRSIYIPLRIKHYSKTGIIAINLDSDWLGLGARMISTIELLMYAEEKGLLLTLRYGYKKKRDHVNYFSALFNNKMEKRINEIQHSKIRYTNIRSVFELKLEKNYNSLLNIQMANKIFNRNIAIANEIEEEVNYFFDTHFKGNKVLGIHYRGTDKVGEAPKMSLNFVRELVLETMRDNVKKFSKLFISTDEQSCIEYFRKSDLPLEIIWREDLYRSEDGSQFHRRPESDMTIVNREALINCLLLAKCDFLIKTASILSDCSKIFNPELEMIIINQPYSENLIWWPATELNRKYLYRSSVNEIEAT